jgi:drug/metabolite transporter (DMT)-like permease
MSRRSTTTFRERDPEILARQATKRRYTYAAFFLLLSLISFCVQTETAVYIQRKLNWNKPYCMMYMTHGSWIVLWPLEILILRVQKWNQPFPQFWRRHVQIVRQTALMVKHQTINLAPWQLQEGNKVFTDYMLRATAFVTTVLTVAGSSWYISVRLTTPSDLTAIYHCSAFFAYAFSVPMLHERIKMSKVVAVGIAISGVLIMAYGGSSAAPKHGSKSGGGAGGPDHGVAEDMNYRFLGNIIMGGGSILYGFYEVLYKKVACPPDDTSPGRGVIFANAFGSMVGAFTLLVLWIPLPVLNYMGWEVFELPRGEQAWMMAISVLSNVGMCNVTSRMKLTS